MKAQVAAGCAGSSFNDQRRIAGAETGHLKIEERLAAEAGIERTFEGLGRTFDARGDFGTGRGVAIFRIANGNLQGGAFSGEPAFGIGEFQS